MNWYIGQRIIAIVDHSQGAFKKGDEFKIKGLRPSTCKCKSIQIYVGIDADATIRSTYSKCRVCDIRHNNYEYKWWFKEKCFAPIDERPELSEYIDENILEVVIPGTLIDV